jgi:hypothetical protein
MHHAVIQFIMIAANHGNINLRVCSAEKQIGIPKFRPAIEIQASDPQPALIVRTNTDGFISNSED